MNAMRMMFSLALPLLLVTLLVPEASYAAACPG